MRRTNAIRRPSGDQAGLSSRFRRRRQADRLARPNELHVDVGVVLPPVHSRRRRPGSHRATSWAQFHCRAARSEGRRSRWTVRPAGVDSRWTKIRYPPARIISATMTPAVSLHPWRARAPAATTGAGAVSAGETCGTWANGLATTSAANRYPCLGTVSIHADASSPSAFRSVEIWNERWRPRRRYRAREPSSAPVSRTRAPDCSRAATTGRRPSA
jgi:hypothetical protein